MEPRILHIVDDEIFLGSIVAAFERNHPGGNRFLLNLPPGQASKFGGVPEGVVQATYGSPAYTAVLEATDSYDLLFLHGLYQSYKFDLLRSVRDRKWVHVSFWGGDIYNRIRDYPLYMPRTQAYIRAGAQNSRVKRMRSALRSRLGRLLLPRVRNRDVYRWIDSFSTVLSSEEGLVRQTFGMERALYLTFTYGSTIPALENLPPRSGSQHVLVGNNANATGNHLDMIDRLQALGLAEGRKLILPLSYAGVEAYRNLVREAYTKAFPGQVEVLADVVPILEYRALLNTCSHVVLPHLRQQAIGNLIIAIALGLKVFLCRENLAYQAFSDLGVKLYLLEDLEREWDRPETDEVVARNRACLLGYYNRTQMDRRIHDMIERWALEVQPAVAP